MDDSILCIIPARGDSRRLPRKNILPLCGKPMLAWTIEAALESGCFSQVWVSTEDRTIASIATRYGAGVLNRKPELATDKASMADVALDAIIEDGGYGAICILPPSAPLRTAEDIRQAVDYYHAYAGCDGLMAIAPYNYPPWQAVMKSDGEADMGIRFIRPYWEWNDANKKSQLMPTLYGDSGAIYIVSVEALQRERTLWVRRLIGWEIDPLHAIDVDTADQFRLAEIIMKDRLACLQNV